MNGISRLLASSVTMALVAAGCCHPSVTAVPLSSWNQCEPPGIPFYLPKPLLVITKNVRYIEEAHVGLTDSAPIPGTFDDQAKYADAERLLRETLDMQRRVLGSEHQDTLWSTQVLAESLRAEGHLLDAEKLQRETLSIRERVLGPEHPDTLGSMEVLAVTLDMLHRYPEAAELYRKAIDVQKRVLGPDHPATASSKYDLACNFALSGRRDQAVATLRDAVEHGLSARTASAIDKDSDFNSLHGDLRFEALVARAKGGAAPAQKSH